MDMQKKIHIGRCGLTILLIFSGLIIANSTIDHSKIGNWIHVEYLHEYPKGTVSKRDLKNISDEYLLAMVAIHECINLCPQDAKYICEATWNRVELNWGNYGNTLAAQLQSSEFKGLIDSNFYFNPFNKKHLFALECAKRVLKGEKEVHHKQIVGWLTHYDNDYKHVNKAIKRVIATPTWHKFWTEK